MPEQEKLIEIGKIQLSDGKIYNLKDLVLRDKLNNALTYKIAYDSESTPEGFTWYTTEGKAIVGHLPASEDTLNYIYLIPNTTADPASYTDNVNMVRKQVATVKTGDEYIFNQLISADVNINSLQAIATVVSQDAVIGANATLKASEPVVAFDLVTKESANKFVVGYPDLKRMRLETKQLRISLTKNASINEVVIDNENPITAISGDITKSERSVARAGEAKGVIGSTSFSYVEDDDGEGMLCMSEEKITPAESNGTVSDYTFKTVSIPSVSSKAVAIPDSVTAEGGATTVATGALVPTSVAGDGGIIVQDLGTPITAADTIIDASRTRLKVNAPKITFENKDIKEPAHSISVEIKTK